MRLTITSEWEIDEEMAGTTDTAKLCAKIQELVRSAVSADFMCHDRYEDGPSFIVGPFRSRPTDAAYIAACSTAVPALLRHVEELTAERDRLREALGISDPYPVSDVLEILASATQHLLRDHDHDGHAWEIADACVKKGVMYAVKLRAALDGTPKDQEEVQGE